MEWRRLVRMLRRSWWLIALAVASAAGSSAYFTARQAPAYEVSTTLVIAPRDGITNRHEILDSLNTLDRRSIVATFAKIPLSRVVREAAQQQLALTAQHLRPYRVRTSVLPDTNIVKVTVEGPDPSLAALLANAIADQSTRHIKRVYRLYTFKTLDPAIQPSQPVRPSRARTLGTGTALGLLLGVGLGFLVDAGGGRRR